MTPDIHHPLRQPPVSGFGEQYAAEQLRRSRHPLRRFVKGFYLRHAAADVHGPSIDFGCGAGQLLAALPPGSIGLEVNPFLIDDLRGRNLQVVEGSGNASDFDLAPFEAGRFDSVIVSHVFEHLDDPATALRHLLRSCGRLGIQRLVVIVPGRKGYASDATHRTFIDEPYLASKGLRKAEGFSLSRIDYFPGNSAWIGNFFTFHEMKVVFARDR